MEDLKIVTVANDPELLRKRSREIPKVLDFHRKLAAQMFEFMEDTYGKSAVGLAAPQVGYNIRMFIIDTETRSEALIGTFINPEILSRADFRKGTEGCLSVPETGVRKERAHLIKVRYLDISGATVERELKGFAAVVFQHELDHLDGKLIID